MWIRITLGMTIVLPDQNSTGNNNDADQKAMGITMTLMRLHGSVFVVHIHQNWPI